MKGARQDKREQKGSYSTEEKTFGELYSVGFADLVKLVFRHAKHTRKTGPHGKTHHK